MTVEELLDRISRDRASFETLWHGLTDEQLTQIPGPQDDWSIKDLIAHMAFWEDYAVERADRLLAGDDVKPNTKEKVDKINAEAYAKYKDVPLQEILAWFARGLERLSQKINQLSEEQLNNKDIIKYGQKTLLDSYIGTTFGHYAAHWGDLETYVERL